MASFTLTTASNAAENLSGGQVGFITATGALVSAATAAVNMTATSILTVAGGLQGTDYGANLVNGGQVNISSTGVVVSALSAIYATGTGQVSVTKCGNGVGRVCGAEPDRRSGGGGQQRHTYGI